MGYGDAVAWIQGAVDGLERRVKRLEERVAGLEQATQEEPSDELCEQDLRIDVFRSSDVAGTTVAEGRSAVRITHLPTGLYAVACDERSMLQNKAVALEDLTAQVKASGWRP